MNSRVNANLTPASNEPNFGPRSTGFVIAEKISPDGSWLRQINQAPRINEKMNSEEIQTTYNQIISHWTSKYKLNPSLEKFLRYMVKFLDDDFSPRIYCALGNEFAEATKQTLKEMKLPTFIASPIYYGGWALALGVAFLRMCLRGLGEQTLKPFVGTLAQDMISTIIGPTLVVNAANAIQNATYKLMKIPQFLSMFVRPTLSLYAAKLAIPKLDEYLAVPLGKLTTRLATDEVWEKIGLRFGQSIEKALGVQAA